MAHVECTCQRCGKTFPVRPYRANVARFCSYACTHPAQIDLICETCDKPFTRAASGAVSAQYCSNACRGIARRVAVPDRFWPKVDKDGPLPDRHPEFGACWLWTGGTTNGYGSFTIDRREVGAHNAAYRLASGGLIPKGMAVCHTCDVRLCVRNDEPGTYVVGGIEYPRWGHLFCAPHTVNSMDMVEKGLHAHGERHMSRTKPEVLVRGDQHWTRRMPERLRRGDENPMRQHPEFVQGERNGNARLTTDQVLEIRRVWAEGGVTQTALSLRYGVSGVLIGLIVRGKAWKHLL